MNKIKYFILFIFCIISNFIITTPRSGYVNGLQILIVAEGTDCKPAPTEHVTLSRVDPATT